MILGHVRKLTGYRSKRLDGSEEGFKGTRRVKEGVRLAQAENM